MIRHALLASTTLALLLSSPAFAQDEPPVTEEGAIADIVVTAQRREQSAQDVPIAISAFSADQLEAQGVGNTLQLGQYVPNLTAQNNTGLGSANAYYLRGLGNTETIATFDPPVGTYVDDIYISRQNANNLSLFDVERVEVLRGPQGTLFGRNTTGGAINVIMRKPGDEIGGYAEIGYGSYRKKLARGSIDLPLADSFAIKVSGYWQDDRGYAKNITLGTRVNDDDGWGVRLGIRGDLSPSVRWNASYAHIVAKGENLFNYDCNPLNPSDCDGRFVTTGLREDLPSPSPYPAGISGRKANFGLGNDAASDLITSTLEFDVAEDTTLALITGYVHLTQQFGLDFFDGTSSPSLAVPRPVIRGFARGGFTILNDGQHEQFSQEIKLNGGFGDGLIDYVAGFYYIDERNRTDFADIFSIAGAPGGTGLLLADRILRNRLKAYAGYAQVDLNIGALTATAGIRYTDETKSFSLRDNRAICRGAVLAGGCLDNSQLRALNGTPIPRKLSTDLFTPRFALNFKASEDINIFASATRGFKSGGWNARGLNITSGTGAFLGTEILPFGPEKVWSYEAGIKSDLFDRRVRVNLTAFYLDVSDLQTPSALVRPNGSIAFITRNFADYRNQGIEAELLFVPVDGLTLFANGGYQDDKYKVPQGGPATDAFGIQTVASQLAECRAALAAGKIPKGPNTPAGFPSINTCGAGIVTANGNISTPVRTPKWTLALGASYKAEFGDGLSLTPSINASYRSKQQVGTSNLSYFDTQVTGVNGTFPSNPFGTGAFITGSQSPSAWVVNAGLALKSESGFQISVDCTNCFDEEFIQSTLGEFSYLNQPRMWMVRGKYSF